MPRLESLLTLANLARKIARQDSQHMSLFQVFRLMPRAIVRYEHRKSGLRFLLVGKSEASLSGTCGSWKSLTARLF
jgi:hypothetical protein